MSSAPELRRPLAMILAVAENGALGLGGDLPWDEPEDRAFFQETTRGHAVVMGRRTFDETGEPLEGRTNIVVSRSMPPRPGVVVVPDLDAALEAAWAVDPQPFVIGGAQLFHAVLPKVTRIYLTEIPGAPAADVYFVFDRTPFVVRADRRSPAGLRYLTLERR